MSSRPDDNGAAATCIITQGELLTALLHKFFTQEDRESPPTAPSSKIINASCSGGSTCWPKVQWCPGDIAQKKRKRKRSVFCAAKHCGTGERKALFSALFVSHAVTLNRQMELLDKTEIFSRVKLAWILFFIMHLSVHHDSQGAAGKQNKISSFDWLQVSPASKTRTINSFNFFSHFTPHPHCCVITSGHEINKYSDSVPDRCSCRCHSPLLPLAEFACPPPTREDPSLQDLLHLGVYQPKTPKNHNCKESLLNMRSRAQLINLFLVFWHNWNLLMPALTRPV